MEGKVYLDFNLKNSPYLNQKMYFSSIIFTVHIDY
jgi:hypothetical protein